MHCVSKNSVDDSEKCFSTQFRGLLRNMLHFPEMLAKLSGDISLTYQERDIELRYLSSEYGLKNAVVVLSFLICFF